MLKHMDAKGLSMYREILITELNDFIFCPVSIYFHKLYGKMETRLYQSSDQINGTAAHKKVDMQKYSDKKSVLMAVDVYCEKYSLIGKIDVFDVEKRVLRERKKKVKTIYDGYVFQIYAQYYALEEMGYRVDRLEIYSMDDHKTYPIPLPSIDNEMKEKFEKVISDIKNFNMDSFRQTNMNKCERCIYEPSCDKSLL